MGRGKGGGEQELENSKMVKGGWRGTGGCLGGFQIGPRTFGQWTVGPRGPTVCPKKLSTGAQLSVDRLSGPNCPEPNLPRTVGRSGRKERENRWIDNRVQEDTGYAWMWS